MSEEKTMDASTKLKTKTSKPRFGNVTNVGAKDSKPRFGKAAAAVPTNEVKEEMPSTTTKPVFGQAASSSLPEKEVKTKIENEEPKMESIFADEDDDEDGAKVILRKRKLQTKEDKGPNKKRAFGKSAESRTHTEKRQEKGRKLKSNLLNSVFEEDSARCIGSTSPKGQNPKVGMGDLDQLVADVQLGGHPRPDTPGGDDGCASYVEIAEPVVQRGPENYVQAPIPGQGGYPTKLDGRFLLAWNFYGKVYKSRASEVDMWSYEVEKSSQSNRFKHTMEFTQADMGPAGVVFGGGLRLKYLPEEFSHEEWEVDMVLPSCAVAIGGDFIAVVTEDSCLRILTLAGIDSVVYRLPGSPMALAAAGALLSVTYSVSSTLHVQFFNIEERKKLCELPLSFGIDPEHAGELQWVHVTPNGNMFAMDTKFQVQLLSKGFGWSWVPVLDLSLRQFVHPVWVEDGKTECLMTAGLSEGGCPDVRLPLEEVKMKYPMSVISGKKEVHFSGVVEMLLRKKLFFEQDPSKNQKKKKKVLEKFRLKAFSFAITSGLSEAKCMDIANGLQLQVSEQFAAKLAFDSGMHALSDKIGTKSRKRLERKRQLEQLVPGGGTLSTLSSLHSTPAKSQGTPARLLKRKLGATVEKKKIFAIKTSRVGLVPAGANVISGAGASAKKAFRRNPFGKN